MNEVQVRTLAQVRQVLAGTQAMEFQACADDAGRYAWIESVLKRFEYRLLARADRGSVLAYLQRLSGYSRAQITRQVMSLSSPLGLTQCSSSQSLRDSGVRLRPGFCVVRSRMAWMSWALNPRAQYRVVISGVVSCRRQRVVDRLHGLIERLPKTHRYRLTDEGLRTALFYTRVYARILRPGMAPAVPAAPAGSSKALRQFHAAEQAVNSWCDEAYIAA